MIKSVQTVGEPIQLVFSEAEFDEHFDHIGRMEAGHSFTSHHEWLAKLLAGRGLPALPKLFCWHLSKMTLTIKEVQGS